MGRIPDHLLRLAHSVAEGRWVTIGAKADPKRPGKKKGGTPVELDGDGVIQKGPAALTGKRPSELSQSHLFTGQPHKSQRKLFAEPGDPAPPPQLDPEAKPQAPAKKEPKAKKPQNMSLLAVIRREGGISGGDFEHADFREHGLLGALNKNGFGIDDMAAMLVRGGHMIVPHGVSSPGDHLLQLLKKKTHSLLADKTSELEQDYEAYARAREEALADGHQERELEEVRGRGQETGADAGTGDILEEIFGPDLGRGGEAGAEGPGDLAGDAAEPAGGVDTSFDFGPAAAPKVEEKPKKAPSDKPKGATLQPDGTLKTKDGTVWVRAKAGGEHSPVTDKHYKGGQWMPIHGMSKPKVEKPAEEPVATQAVEPGEGDKEQAEDKGPRMREPRQPATPEEIAQKQKDQEHWDTVKQGPLGRIRGWMGDFPNKRGAEASMKVKAWQKFADELGPEKVKQIADEMERRRIDRLAKAYDGWTQEEKGGDTKEEVLDFWRKNWANDKWGLGLRHVAKNPDSARAAMHLFNEMGQPQTPQSLRELNDYLAGVQSGKDEPAAPPALDQDAKDKRPKIGDQIKTRLGGSNEEQPDFEINLMPANKPGHFAIGQGSIKAKEIPLESFDNFIDDMTGKVSVPADSGVAEIDAVASGKAKHLGRGDDGSAFQVGDKVVKTSTVSPFIPTNPGHRTPQEGLNRLHDQTMTHNKLAEILKEKGVGGVEPLEWHEHGGRGFAVSNLLDTKTKLNAEQLNKVRKTVDAIHGAGYAVGDDIQVGLNKNGEPVLYDLGKANKLSSEGRGAGDALDYDGSKFEKFAKQNGHEDALPLRSSLLRQLDGIKNSTSKYAEKIRTKLQDQLRQLDGGSAEPPEAPEQKNGRLWDEYRKAKAARAAADNSDNPEDAFQAEDALGNAELALKKAGLDPAKKTQQAQGPAAPPKLNLFGQSEPTKPQPATTQGLFGEQVPVEDKKAQPQPTAAEDAAKGLDWLDQKQDKKTDGTGEMFGGLFSPGQQAGPNEPPKVPTGPKSQSFDDYRKENNVRGYTADHSMLSPSGKVSGRAANAARARVDKQFSDYNQAEKEYQAKVDAGEIVDPTGKYQKPDQNKVNKAEAERMRTLANQFRSIAARGMQTRKLTKQAEDLERQANELDPPAKAEGPVTPPAEPPKPPTPSTPAPGGSEGFRMSDKQKAYRDSLTRDAVRRADRMANPNNTPRGAHQAFANMVLAMNLPDPKDQKDISGQLDSLKAGSALGYAKANRQWAEPILKKMADRFGPNGEWFSDWVNSEAKDVPVEVKMRGDLMEHLARKFMAQPTPESARIRAMLREAL